MNVKFFMAAIMVAVFTWLAASYIRPVPSHTYDYPSNSFAASHAAAELPTELATQ